LGEDQLEMIRKTVADAIAVQMKDFYVEREKHYQHHQFIDGLIKWQQGWKSTCMRAIAYAVVNAIIGLIVLGYIAWGGKAFKG